MGGGLWSVGSRATGHGPRHFVRGGWRNTQQKGVQVSRVHTREHNNSRRRASGYLVALLSHAAESTAEPQSGEGGRHVSYKKLSARARQGQGLKSARTVASLLCLSQFLYCVGRRALSYPRSREASQRSPSIQHPALHSPCLGASPARGLPHSIAVRAERWWVVHQREQFEETQKLTGMLSGTLPRGPIAPASGAQVA